MKTRFQPGEKVKFLHDKGEGIVLQVYPNDRLLVLLDDIFEVEVSTSEIVKSSPQDEKSIPVSDSSFNSEKGIYLVIELGPRLRYHLLNNTYYDLSFNFFLNTEGERYVGKVSGAISPFAAQLLMVFLKENRVENSRLLFQFLFFQEKNEKIPPAPEQVSIEVKDRYFQKTPIRIPGIAHECILIALLVEKKPVQNSLPIPEVPLANEKSTLDYDVPSSEVDLHIEKLVPNSQELSKEAIFAKQMEVFEKALSQAWAFGREEIIFIHGVGNGVLKDEIHKVLRKTPFVKEFSIDKSGKYGQGATIVRFNSISKKRFSSVNLRAKE